MTVGVSLDTEIHIIDNPMCWMCIIIVVCNIEMKPRKSNRNDTNKKKPIQTTTWGINFWNSFCAFFYPGRIGVKLFRLKDVDKSSQGLKADDLGLDDMCSVCAQVQYKYEYEKKTYRADTIANTHQLGLRMFIGLVYTVYIVRT